MLLRTASVSARKQHEPSTILRISNVTGYCILILVNVLAGTGVFGPTNAEISGRYPTPLTPEG